MERKPNTRYEQEKLVRRMKTYRIQVGVCSALCWAFTVFILLVNAEKLMNFVLVPISGIILTICFLYISHLIIKTQNLI